MNIETYQIDVGTIDQYSSVFQKLRENRVHTRTGLFQEVWSEPGDWIKGKTLLITDGEKVASFISERQFFHRLFDGDDLYFGMFGVYVSPELRNQGISSKLAKETSDWLGKQKAVICRSPKVDCLTKYFYHCDIVL